MVEYAGRGDPRRSMALLWGQVDEPTRGPRPGLDLQDVVAAAIAVADAEGLAGVSMRKVGERLGRSAMSLYTYVPGKAELLDLMLDRVLGELLHDEPLAGTWREGLAQVARDRWDFYARHPWVLQISAGRAALGPNEFAVFEQDLAVLDGVSLSGYDMVQTVGVIGSFVRGSAQAVAEAAAAEQATGLSDDDWWGARAPLLEGLADDEWQQRFPTLARLDNEQAFSLDIEPDSDSGSYTVQEARQVFEFGLARILDGIEAYISGHHAG